MTLSSNAPAAVVTERLGKVYNGRAVLDDINLTIPAGQVVALLGRSGSGKTTLLRILSGLEEPTAGQFRVAGRFSVVFQEPRLVPNKKVWQNVALGHRGPDWRRKAEGLLAEVGLNAHADLWPGILSGGEAQRVGVARALSQEPEFLLLDEPFAALDALTRLEIQALSLRLREQHGFAALLVTHDVEEAVAMADRVLVLRDGRISLDLAVDIPTPRRRSLKRFTDICERLLHELGVDVDAY
ncbi:aliphatic sulfonates import ATP-binding protein SsuB [Kaistia sp. 32K]|uniref:ABC transporter ATP-binding protein n=1 Tax=Kaistia sp. 32K TaxID=2795690 RepID=UPI001916837D|nr:ABC transporter ATP-binding protein [Kaistia sp. 32K]BCP52244.1 aliphatic sulfonates import ATP-binding protein SsuB [Kaistia sp. 32K]